MNDRFDASSYVIEAVLSGASLTTALVSAQLARLTGRFHEMTLLKTSFFLYAVALALVAGAPAILGAWIGGYTSSDVMGVLFFAIAAGAAFQVVVEVGRYVARTAPGGLRSSYAIGGFLAGITAMYLTGVLAG